MTAITLSVPDILANCPKKLLKHYPRLAQQLEYRKKAKKAGLKPEYMPKPPILVLEGSRLGGKELGIDEEVKTPTGAIKIKDAKVGTSILGQDGLTHTVTGYFPQGKKDLYRVTFTDGSSVLAGKEHLWGVLTKKKISNKHGVDKLKIMTTQDIIDYGYKQPHKQGGYIHKIAIPLCEPIEYEEKEISIDPYVLGVLIGDGSLSGNHLTISNCEDDIYNKIKSLGYPLTDKKLWKNQKGECWRYCIYNRPKSYNKELEKLGLKVKSKDKFIPEIYLRGSVNQRIELLKGLMDTDGYASGTCAQYTTISYTLAKNIVELVQSLGGIAKIYKPDTRKGNACYKINIWLKFNPFFTKRKAVKWKSKKNLYRYIDNIEFEKNEEAVCIMTDEPNHLFLTNDFIVTHNSQFAMRSVISLILDGYAQSAMLATITEDGSKDTGELLDRILEEAEEPVIFSRHSDRPVRILSNGEPFFIEFLNKVDSKARQTKADVLILEELEKWNETAGNTALYTMIRHFDCFVVLSNQLPRWARVFFDSFGAVYDRIDYWENEALEPAIKAALDNKRVTDPEGWARDVMYQPTGGADRVFTERALNNAFLKINTDFRPRISILSIDCGAGGADNSVVFRLDMDAQFVIRAHLLMDESLAPEPLCQRIAQMKVDEQAIEEVWDANGVGGAIMQFRAPKEEWNYRGIIPHIGAATDPNTYYNARAEAYMLTAQALQNASLRVSGLSIKQQEELALEIRSTTFRQTEEARTHNTFRIEKKQEIKKRLGGLSPNKLDALCIGVWRLLTFHRNNIKVETNGYNMTPIISGVPTL